jgi:hypothetical protein
VTHQLLAYADGVNLLGDSIDTIKKNTETLIDASKEVGLEINAEKTKCMLLSHHQNVGQNRDIKIANRSFENVALLRYLGAAVAKQNMVQEEIKRRLISDMLATIQCRTFCVLVCCIKTKIRIYKTIILPVVLYGCETWSLTLREEQRLRVF